MLFNLSSYIALLFAEGKPIPTELRNEEADLRRQVELEDDNTGGPAAVWVWVRVWASAAVWV